MAGKPGGKGQGTGRGSNQGPGDLSREDRDLWQHVTRDAKPLKKREPAPRAAPEPAAEAPAKAPEAKPKTANPAQIERAAPRPAPPAPVIDTLEGELSRGRAKGHVVGEDVGVLIPHLHTGVDDRLPVRGPAVVLEIAWVQRRLFHVVTLQIQDQKLQPQAAAGSGSPSSRPVYQRPVPRD